MTELWENKKMDVFLGTQCILVAVAVAAAATVAKINNINNNNKYTEHNNNMCNTVKMDCCSAYSSRG